MSEHMRIQSELNTDLEVYRLKGELLELREQNRVLREALQEIYEGRWTPGVSCCYEDDARDIYPTREMRIRNIAMAALTATSQPQPPYKEWCRHPEKCAGLASCPQDPTCAD